MCSAHKFWICIPKATREQWEVIRKRVLGLAEDLDVQVYDMGTKIGVMVASEADERPFKDLLIEVCRD